jgi:hypothetical protein
MQPIAFRQLRLLIQTVYFEEALNMSVRLLDFVSDLVHEGEVASLLSGLHGGHCEWECSLALRESLASSVPLEIL